MTVKYWQDELKPILIKKIDEALTEANGQDIYLPWMGNHVERAMSNAALAVLEGIEDSQQYLREEEMLSE